MCGLAWQKVTNIRPKISRDVTFGFKWRNIYNQEASTQKSSHRENIRNGAVIVIRHRHEVLEDFIGSMSWYVPCE